MSIFDEKNQLQQNMTTNMLETAKQGHCVSNPTDEAGPSKSHQDEIFEDSSSDSSFAFESSPINDLAKHELGETSIQPDEDESSKAPFAFQSSPPEGSSTSYISHNLDAINQLKERLFSTRDDIMGEIPDILKEIVYHSVQVENHFGQQPIKRLALSLLAAAQISDDKCKQGLFLQYHRWTREFGDKPSLLRHVDHYQRLQTTACTDLLNRLSEDVGFVGLPNLRNLLLSLDAEPSGSRAGTFYKTLPVFKLEQFLARKLNDWLGSATPTKDRAARMINSLVISMFGEECSRIQSRGRDVIELHKQLVWFVDPETKLILSNKAKRLLGRANLCHHLIYDEDYSLFRVYELYRQQRQVACFNPAACVTGN